MEKLFVYPDEVKFENKKEFEFLVIKPSMIDNFDFNDPGYLNKLISSGFTQNVQTNPDNFFEKLGEYLLVNQMKEEDRHVVTHVVSDEPEYMYEVMFLNISPKNRTKKLENQFASLINIHGEKIYGNMIVMKTHLPKLSNSMLIDKMNCNDLYKILNDRVDTKMVIWDDGEFIEERSRLETDKYAQHVFEGEFYHKIEIPFLLHNLNIYYTTSDYGENVFPNLIGKKVDKVLFFSMFTESLRGSITKDEIIKITKLSDYLNNYKPKNEWIKSEKDDLERNIIKNKYRVLELAWNEYNLSHNNNGK